MGFYDDETQVLDDVEISKIGSGKTETELLEEALINQKSYSDFDLLYSDSIKTSSFVNEFRKLMLERNIEVTKMMQETKFSKSYFYQLLNGVRKPSRDAVISIAIALNCDLKETNYLLKVSEKQELYAKNKRDSIFIYSISRMYSIKEINELLMENEQQLL